jgi:hypothetical protein
MTGHSFFSFNGGFLQISFIVLGVLMLSLSPGEPLPLQTQYQHWYPRTILATDFHHH